MVFTVDDEYDLVYADPPWSYRDKSLHRGGAERHYRTMSIKEIRSLPINKISKDNSVLFLWSTFPMLQESIGVISAWGFAYKTIGFVWVKTNKDGSLFTGMGHYTRSNSEVCLIGVKGKGLKRLHRGVRSVVQTQRLKHSEKPQEVVNRIEQLYGTDIKRIELFARKHTPGWDYWGDEL